MTVLRVAVAVLSLCGLLGWGAMFLFIVGMGGFGATRADPLVVSTLATPLIFFVLCFLCALRRFARPSLLVMMACVVLLTLPYFWFLVVNGSVIVTALLGGFLALWLLMCREQWRQAE